MVKIQMDLNESEDTAAAIHKYKNKFTTKQDAIKDMMVGYNAATETSVPYMTNQFTWSPEIEATRKKRLDKEDAETKESGFFVNEAMPELV
jgi:histidinol phosphatase-like enzyme